MITRADLQRLANREKLALGTLEKDYILTEVLKALSRVQTLSQLLVFKGGTALRKVYFSDWRYSEDLDFTARHDITKDELSEYLEKWYDEVEQASQIQLVTKMLHKPNGYARVRTQFTGPLSYPGMIFMDLSFDEPICLEPENRKILTNPFADNEQKVLVYPMEELLAEKMRSLLERGKSRDYYDVWRILKEHFSSLDLKILSSVLSKKIDHKGLTLHNINEFLPTDVNGLRQYWEKDLEQQISSLTSLDEVLNELKAALDELIAPHFKYSG
jgi:predicted nucleotidyltransferase component of viral defense system